MSALKFSNLFVCPVCKIELEQKGNDGEITCFECKACSSVFPVVDKTPDFRFTPAAKDHFETWQHTQVHFEKFIWHYDTKQAKLDDIANAEIYKNIELKGKVLDIGGSQGFLRKYVPVDSEYVCIDPWPDAKNSALKLSKNMEFSAIYPCLKEDYNFMVGFGEGIPFPTGYFDWVHIRSVLDHVFDPMVVIKEASRVINQNGRLLVNLTLTDGPNVRHSTLPNIFYRAYRKLKTEGIGSFARKVFDVIRGVDSDHMHHPSSLEIIKLVREGGFNNIDSKWISDVTGIQGDFLLIATK